MKVTYAIPSGGYAGLEKLFSPKPDWKSASGLRIRVNVPQGHRVHVQIYDQGGERWEYVTPPGDGTWHTLNPLFTSFTNHVW